MTGPVTPRLAQYTSKSVILNEREGPRRRCIPNEGPQATNEHNGPAPHQPVEQPILSRPKESRRTNNEVLPETRPNN